MKSLALLVSTLLLAAPAHAALDNTLVISINDEDAVAYLKSGKEKYDFQSPTFTLNGGDSVGARMTTRGQNCARAPRRCFGVRDLEGSLKFVGAGDLSGKDFNLVSMWQDEGYLSSRLGYKASALAGLPTVRNEYAEVFLQVAGAEPESNGLYLVTEKPAAALAKRYHASAVLRRRYDGTSEVENIPKGEPDAESRAKQKFGAIYEALRDQAYSGQELVDFLSSRMDLVSYMRWLALNSLLKNGDYSDEVFFSLTGEGSQERFEVMGWDFDDLFKPMHKSLGSNAAEYKKAIAGTILYNYDDLMDVSIARDDVAYALFETIARELLTDVLTDEAIDGLIDSTALDLSPALDVPRILALSAKDDFTGAYTKGGVLDLAEKRRSEIKARRAELLKTLSH